MTSEQAGGSGSTYERGTTYTSTGRQYTEPVRELAALALLGANAVFLLLAFARLLIVLDGWASGFGARSAATFPVFVGPVSLGLPIVAVLLATHVVPMLRRHRLIVVVACLQYAVSAVLGFATLLGAFADDLPSARAALEGLLWRGVWFTLLVVGGLVLARLYLGLVPPVPSLSALLGSPLPAGTGPAAAIDEPTIETAWPVVPPAPQPHKPAPPAPPQGQAPGARSETPARPAPGSARPVFDDPVEPPTRHFER